MPRRWHQVRGKPDFPGMRVARKPGRPGEHGAAVNTIARGMPGDCRCDLTNACVAIYRIHCTRGHRAHRAPGIPAPSGWRGRDEQARPRAKRAAGTESHARCMTADIRLRPSGRSTRSARPAHLKFGARREAVLSCSITNASRSKRLFPRMETPHPPSMLRISGTLSHRGRGEA